MITLNEDAKPEMKAFTNTCAFIVQNAGTIGTNILYINFPGVDIKEGEQYDFTFTLANINGKLCQA
jgi:hypothetical protein